MRVEYRPNDRLAMALLSGRAKHDETLRRGSQKRWRQKREWDAYDAEVAAVETTREAQRRAYRKQCEDFVAANTKPREPRQPRIRTL